MESVFICRDEILHFTKNPWAVYINNVYQAMLLVLLLIAATPAVAFMVITAMPTMAVATGLTGLTGLTRLTAVFTSTMGFRAGLVGLTAVFTSTMGFRTGLIGLAAFPTSTNCMFSFLIVATTAAATTVVAMAAWAAQISFSLGIIFSHFSLLFNFWHDICAVAYYAFNLDEFDIFISLTKRCHESIMAQKVFFSLPGCSDFFFKQILQIVEKNLTMVSPDELPRRCCPVSK